MPVSSVAVLRVMARSWMRRSGSGALTLANQREGNEWRLAHRHADPLVEKISMQRSAALASGKRPDES